MPSNARYRGVFPVAPTTFNEAGELDLASQKRCIDFMIDAGSQGICILANFSEQFVLADDERELLARTIIEHVAGRVPVIVTTTHFSTRLTIERSQRAQALGAAMVMVMPPYHGATIRAPEGAIVEFFAATVRGDLDPDHDPGRAGQRHGAAGRSCSRAWRARSSRCRTSRSRPPARPASCAS